LNAEHHDPSAAARVFVVDDDVAVRTAISLLVQTCGWQAVPCADAEEFFRRYTPDDDQCLILDLQMPGCSGGQLLHKLRDQGDNVPVIVVTAHFDEAGAEGVYQQGAFAVLRKPSEGAELEGWIRRALNIH
jgi:FixJ family two-component response regulator